MWSPLRRFSTGLHRSAGAHLREHGFTLIEVLVSLAVLAVCLSAIGTLMAASIRTAGAIEDHLALTETARAVWSALPDRNELKTGSRTGDMDGQRWRLSVQPYVAPYVDKDSPSPWTPQRVTLMMRSPSGALLQIDTVRLRKRGDR
ncbi:general secretion pathway protein I [Rhizobiales bacterium GAS191]|nr:general secretion pathway protein I [Rhizobiales bacterium GAS113]SEC06800.1 general secretion pathway protein I [Rhizobiales bacterium GAS191]